MVSTILMSFLLTVGLSSEHSGRQGGQDERGKDQTSVKLPAPRLDGAMALEQAILKRRSVREYSARALTLAEVSQLLWAAQGETDEGGGRSSPSAGALYPLEVYVVAENVGGLQSGLYRYKARDHELQPVLSGKLLGPLSHAALDQEALSRAPAVIVMTAVPSRTTRKYGDRGRRYVHIEAGHAAQNVALQAIALSLGTVTIGAFRDAEVAELLELPDGEEPLYLLPVGQPVHQ
jgi:SagB-type dehydrogenase family enzyme